MAQKDGLWRTVALRPWRDADGQIAGVIGVAMTVQELKIAAEKLRVANERLSSHMDNSPLLVIDLDASLNITHCSIRSQQVFGQLPDDLVGCNVFAQLGGLHADSLRVSFERLQRAARNRATTLPRRMCARTERCSTANGSIQR